MTSTASASGSAHSISVGPSTGGNGSGGGGMDELLPLVLQLTNAESVSIHPPSVSEIAFRCYYS